MRVQFDDPYYGLATLEQLTGKCYGDFYDTVKRVVIETCDSSLERGIIEYWDENNIGHTDNTTVLLEDTLDPNEDIEALLEGAATPLPTRPPYLKATRQRYRRSRFRR